MEFDIRNLYPYLDVKVTEGKTVIDLGLLDDTERRELADQLKRAVDELMKGLNV